MHVLGKAGLALTGAVLVLGGLIACSPLSAINAVTPSSSYIKTEGVSYADSDNPRQKLDIYRPAAQADACVAGQLRWGYEVGLVPGSDSGFSVDGIRVDAVPAGCVGHRVAITYSAGTSVVGSSVASLSVGVIDRVDRSGLGDVVVTAASLAPVS